MIDFDGTDLTGLESGTNGFTIDPESGFDFGLTPDELTWVERRIGAVPFGKPKRPNMETELPMICVGDDEDAILEAVGGLRQTCEKITAASGTGGTEIGWQKIGATYESTLICYAAKIGKVKIGVDDKRMTVARFTLTLTCAPYIFGPEYVAATGTKPAGIPAADITIADVIGDIPGPMRIVVTNQGTIAQQFALLGAQWRDAVSGNDMLLPASSFDVSTSPLNGTYTAGTNEVQRITPTGTVSGGTWDWAWDGYAITGIAYNASVAAVQALIDSEVGSGLITVGGSALNAGFMSFTFGCDFAARDVAELTVEDASITGGGTLAASTTTAGVEGYVSTPVYSDWTSFARTAEQTDTGTYDLWARVYDAGSTANQVLVRAIISIGDTAVGTANRLATIPATGAAVWVNLGPVHARPQGVGTHKWTATIQAKTLGTEGTTVRVLDVLKVPTEHGRAVVRVLPPSGSSTVLRDNFSGVSGAITGDTSTGGETWASMGGLTDADDFQDAATGVSRSSTGDTSTDMRYGRGVVLGTTDFDRVQVGVDASLATHTGTIRQGVIARLADNDNFAALTWKTAGAGALGSLALRTAVAGVVSLNAAVYVGIGDTSLHRIELAIDEFGGWRALYDGSVVMSGYLAAFATGGDLESGKPGLLDWSSTNSSERNYRNFTVVIPSPIEAAAYAGRSLQWSNDGNLHREASGGTDYSYAQGQQGAGVPLLGPEGAEALVNRLVIASDDQNPDYAATGNQIPQLDYVVYHRPAYALGRHGS